QAREEAYLGALERLGEAALAAAQPEVAAGYLRRAAAVDPLRESAQRALMTALAESGSYAAATEVYRELRRRLHRDLNAEPSPETRALFERLRSQVRQRALRNGLGLESPSLPVPEDLQPPNLEPGSGPRGNLPQPLSAFVGREKEIEEVSACLASVRLVTLTGSGGIGKSRLAIRVAEESA